MKDEHPAPNNAIRDGLIVVGIAVILYITNNITPLTAETVTSGSALNSFISFLGLNSSIAAVQPFLLFIKGPLTILAMLFLAGFFWATLKIREIHHHEHEKYKPIETEETIASEKSIQWQVIVDHVNSTNAAEWKLAILEADNILDEVLEDLGYAGETIAEKLKAMNRTRIASYDQVWEAHKLRNQIAHGGAIDMDLSQKMAKDTIAKFENAFRELGYL